MKICLKFFKTQISEVSTQKSEVSKTESCWILNLSGKPWSYTSKQVVRFGQKLVQRACLKLELIRKLCGKWELFAIPPFALFLVCQWHPVPSSPCHSPGSAFVCETPHHFKYIIGVRKNWFGVGLGLLDPLWVGEPHWAASATQGIKRKKWATIEVICDCSTSSFTNMFI